MASITQNIRHSIIVAYDYNPAPDKKCSQYPEKTCRECAQCCWQIAINLLDVFRESIDYATDGSLIEKLHGSAEDFVEKEIVRDLGSVQCSNVKCECRHKRGENCELYTNNNKNRT